jgi:hypothetical protein
LRHQSEKNYETNSVSETSNQFESLARSIPLLSPSSKRSSGSLSRSHKAASFCTSCQNSCCGSGPSSQHSSNPSMPSLFTISSRSYDYDNVCEFAENMQHKRDVISYDSLKSNRRGNFIASSQGLKESFSTSPKNVSPKNMMYVKGQDCASIPVSFSSSLLNLDDMRMEIGSSQRDEFGEDHMRHPSNGGNEDCGSISPLSCAHSQSSGYHHHSVNLSSISSFSLQTSSPAHRFRSSKLSNDFEVRRSSPQKYLFHLSILLFLFVVIHKKLGMMYQLVC